MQTKKGNGRMNDLIISIGTIRLTGLMMDSVAEYIKTKCFDGIPYLEIAVICALICTLSDPEKTKKEKN